MMMAVTFPQYCWILFLHKIFTHVIKHAFFNKYTSYMYVCIFFTANVHTTLLILMFYDQNSMIVTWSFIYHSMRYHRMYHNGCYYQVLVCIQHQLTSVLELISKGTSCMMDEILWPKDMFLTRNINTVMATEVSRIII